jgi:uncharacterized protein YukJ
MPIPSYGVLTATAIDRRREGSGDSPHFQVQARDDDGIDYRLAINVQSSEAPSDLLYLLDDDFQHPLTAAVESLGPGWHPLAPAPGGPNLDFVRANLFDPADMRVLPPDAAGPDNDLPDLLEHYVQRAIADPAARLHAFGSRWGPEEGVEDKVFHYLPGNGVHEIHMNQGNSAQFFDDDGVFQDGGLLFHFPGEPRWVGVFLAFQSQKFHTDDTTGHALGVEVPASVPIVAALVNPVGPAPEQESVLLLNASPAAVDLTGWQLADRAQQKCPIPGGPLDPGATRVVPVAPPMALGNHGGTITLLDAAGLKASGVAYTEQQARREGWTIVF